MVFTRPANHRQMTFQEISHQAKVPVDEVSLGLDYRTVYRDWLYGPSCLYLLNEHLFIINYYKVSLPISPPWWKTQFP